VEPWKEATGQGAKKLEGTGGFYDMWAHVSLGHWIADGSASDGDKWGARTTWLFGAALMAFQKSLAGGVQRSSLGESCRWAHELSTSQDFFFRRVASGDQ
jgi:hypothetical protein